MSRAIFLDRDGVIIEDTGHPGDAEEIHLLPGVTESLTKLRDSGYLLLVVSNQAGIAKGLFGQEVLGQIEREIVSLMGFDLDGWYYCPHHPEGQIEELKRYCDCRKPKPGMLLQAIEEHHIDPAKSFMFGNMWHDVLAANRAGVKAVLVDSTPEKALADPCKEIATAWATAHGIAEATAAVLSSP
ncbi:MAG: D-glycero-beta-D-manno-heptose-1,7-bisphosphate 7-phosphatase [Acidobacteria bacterium]|nr:MAG: D-glycero-beta-D-manno-heptose-1,7-bisphosphate 7-phosphatase [Acidobacteriota bacterium]